MKIKIFTDGSLIKKNNEIRTGFGVLFPNKEYENISKRLHINDIHYAEIYAIKHSLYIIKNDIPKYDEINFYTDSSHCIKKINKWYKYYKNNEIDKMKTKKGNDIKNKTILLEIYKIMGDNINKFNFIHIKSHSGNKDENGMNNRFVDKLARLGTRLD